MDRCSSMQGDLHLNGEIEILTHMLRHLPFMWVNQIFHLKNMCK